jgi:hypothetical protein
MNLNIEEAFKDRVIRLKEDITIQGDVDFGGRIIIQEHPPSEAFITTHVPTRIANATIVCGTRFSEMQPGVKARAILARDRLVLENVRFENLYGWGVELAGVHSGSRFRDCHLQYENAGQAAGLGYCGIFCGGYNAEDIIVENCRFDGAHAADNFVWLSKGGNFQVIGCRIENFVLEGICLTAGPATVERNWFRAVKPRAAACAALLWVDVPNRNRGTAHYSLEPRFRFINNEVSGVPCMVNAGRPDDRLIPMEMEVTIEGNGFTVDKDAIFLANCKRADITGNYGSAETFVRTVAGAFP